MERRHVIALTGRKPTLDLNIRPLHTTELVSEPILLRAGVKSV